MDSTKVQELLQNALNLEELHVKGEGSHYEVIAVDAQFEGMSRVKKAADDLWSSDGIHSA